MESINKIELAGRVGNVKKDDTDGSVIIRFFLGVDRFIARGGEAAVEVDWFDCHFSSNVANIKDFDPKKGDWLHIAGWLLPRRYVDNEGSERRTYVVIVKEVVR